jgi:outer membrane lipoprotein-sorting protein
MNEHDPIPVEGRVEVAAAAMRELNVPAGPSEELLQRTVARLNAVKMTANRAEKGWWTPSNARRMAVAAGLLVAVGTGALVAIWGGQARVALGDVIAQVKQAQGVRCSVHIEMEMPDHQRQTSTVDMLMVDSGITITSMPGMKMVMDSRNSRMMVLSTFNKTAMMVDIKQSPKYAARQPPNLLEFFTQLTPQGSTALGEKDIGGVTARGFRSPGPTMQAEVWADEKTERPVQVTMLMQNGLVPAATYVFSDFDWNPAIDPHSVAMTPPDGYQVVNSTMDMSDVTEADVPRMLRTLADLNGGVLPAGIDTTGAIAAIVPWEAKRLVEAKEPVADIEKATMEKFVPVGRAWAYMTDKNNGTDWTYAGGGVNVSEKGHAVLWYKPAGSAQWRIIDADGVIHDAAQAPPGGKPLVPGSSTRPAIAPATNVSLPANGT